LKVVLAIAAALLLFATPAAAQDFRISTEQPVDAINPLAMQNLISFTAMGLAYDQLLNFDTDSSEPNLEISLARSYETSRDGLTWTFELRRGISWSDGEPFDADDVVFTYRAVMENETNFLSGYLTNVKRVEKLGSHRVRLRLSAPDARLTNIYVPILPEHVFSRFPLARLDKVDVPLPSVTTAPFRYTAYDKDGTTILEPNPRFRGVGGRAAMDRVLLVNYTDREAQLRDLQLGKIDLVYQGNPRWIASLRGERDVRVWSSPQPGFKEMAFNSCPPGGAGNCSGPGREVNVAVVQDPAIRQALAWGIDRETIARTIYAGQNRPALGLISPYYQDYFKDWSDDPQIGYSYDPEKARQILADGGWDCSSFPCEKNGVRASFELLVRASDPQDKSVVQRIRAWAHDIGIEIDLSVVTETALNNRILNSGSEKGKYEPTYDAFYWAWSGDPTPDLNLEVLRTGSDWQDAFYSDPAYDRASLAALQTTGDLDRRAELMHEAERIAMRDLPYIPTVYENQVFVTRTDTWHGWLPSPPGAGGAPIGANFLQVTRLRPGPEPATAGTIAPAGDGGGTPGIVLFLAGLVVGGGAVALALRRRREPEPLEWPEV
jgi:peptide/nickel transport system substrate-binding protein